MYENSEYDCYSKAAPSIVAEDAKYIASNSLALMIGEHSSDFFGILNYQRQIVFMNKYYFKSPQGRPGLIGMYPGEVLNCIHAHESEGGCGTTEACGYCDILNTIVSAVTSNQQATKEGRVLVTNQGIISSLNVEITAVPTVIEDREFLLLFIKNIILNKMREIFEHTFFHDILNSASNLYSLLQLSRIESDDISDIRDRVDFAIEDIVEQIQFFQKLQNRDAGNTNGKKRRLSFCKEVDQMIKLVSLNRMEQNYGSKSIERIYSNPSLAGYADRVVFRRVVHNMIKNACEATSKNDLITVRIVEDSGYAVIEVTNPQVISEEVKANIFQRSFSTKGVGRGIGTFSMKNLSRRYLNGDVTFESTEHRGTTFSLRFPLLLDSANPVDL